MGILLTKFVSLIHLLFMKEEFRRKEKEESEIRLDQVPKFQKFILKEKEKEEVSDNLLHREDFAAKADVVIEEKLDFEEVELSKEVHIKSSSENLKLGFKPVKGTYSGYFFAKTEAENKLRGLLQDEADPENLEQFFHGVGYIRTHILPNGKAEDKAMFKVLDQDTGNEAVITIVTIPFDGEGLWKSVKNLFS